MINLRFWISVTVLLACLGRLDGSIGVNYKIEDIGEEPKLLGNVKKAVKGISFPKKSYAYLSSGSAGNSNQGSGWPLKPVSFNHPIQSPIDLITYKAVNMYLPALNIVKGHIEGVKSKFYNSGHTVYVYIEEEPPLRPYLRGGPLNCTFIFEQIHFHWGHEDIWGSEHFIDGESFAVEIHAVHFNSKYGTFENASTQPDGLAVLTIFAEASTADNALLNPLYHLLPNITKAKSFVLLPSWDSLQWAASALSTNHEYYTYPGSLTTPPYTENVKFILLPKPIYLSKDQLKAFRSIHGDNNHQVTDNKRNLQPLHNRPIVRSTNLQ